MRLPGFVVGAALAAALALTPGPDLVAANVQLRRAALEALEAHEAARGADPATLVVVSLGERSVLTGVAAGPETGEGGAVGYAYLSGPAGDIGAGIYVLRLQRSGIAVELVDRLDRVVATVALDPPFPGGPGGQQQGRLWPGAFLTVARWLAPRS